MKRRQFLKGMMALPVSVLVANIIPGKVSPNPIKTEHLPEGGFLVSEELSQKMFKMMKPEIGRYETRDWKV